MSDAISSVYNLTAPVVMSHPAVIEARRFKRNGKETGDPKFGGSFVFPPDHPDLNPLKALAAKVARAKWPNRDLKEVKFPFASGDKLIKDRIAKRQKEGKDPADDGKGDFQKGKIVLKSSSKYQPRLAGIENGKVVDYDTDVKIAAAKGKFYFGVEVLAQINFVAYDGVDQNPDGVTAYLNMVLSTGKGERLSGGASASEVFKGYVGHVSAEDPTGGADQLDDEIPF